jgi:hypothetical protein
MLKTLSKPLVSILLGKKWPSLTLLILNPMLFQNLLDRILLTGQGAGCDDLGVYVFWKPAYMPEYTSFFGKGV